METHFQLGEAIARVVKEPPKPMDIKITDIVKGTTAVFDFYRAGKLYYTVETDTAIYKFGIPVTDEQEIGNATFNREEKALLLTRYIRKAIESDELSVVQK